MYEEYQSRGENAQQTSSIRSISEFSSAQGATVKKNAFQIKHLPPSENVHKQLEKTEVCKLELQSESDQETSTVKIEVQKGNLAQPDKTKNATEPCHSSEKEKTAAEVDQMPNKPDAAEGSKVEITETTEECVEDKENSAKSTGTIKTLFEEIYLVPSESIQDKIAPGNTTNEQESKAAVEPSGSKADEIESSSNGQHESTLNSSQEGNVPELKATSPEQDGTTSTVTSKVDASSLEAISNHCATVPQEEIIKESQEVAKLQTELGTDSLKQASGHTTITNTHNSDILDKNVGTTGPKTRELRVPSSKEMARLDVSNVASDTERLELRSSISQDSANTPKSSTQVITFILIMDKLITLFNFVIAESNIFFAIIIGIRAGGVK